MKATMRDVARCAGVSVATVSHVINKTRYVSEKTNRRVMEAIESLGYSPDAIARIFKTGKKNLVGFIVPDIANSFFATIIEGVEDAVGGDRYNLIVANTKETKAREIKSIQLLTSGIVDGLIVASTLDDFKEIEAIAPPQFPIVLLDRTFAGCPYDAITISNYDAVYRSVCSLYDAGHRKIGYIAGLKRLSTTRERLDAYRKALADRAGRGCKAYIQFADSMAESAYRSTELLVKGGCTAIVVSNNVMTVDALRYLGEHGIRANDDIAIVGYSEDSREYFLEKNISYILQPISEMARLAGVRILERIGDPGLGRRDFVLASSFVEAGGRAQPAARRGGR